LRLPATGVPLRGRVPPARCGGGCPPRGFPYGADCHLRGAGAAARRKGSPTGPSTARTVRGRLPAAGVPLRCRLPPAGWLGAPFPAPQTRQPAV